MEIAFGILGALPGVIDTVTKLIAANWQNDEEAIERLEAEAQKSWQEVGAMVANMAERRRKIREMKPKDPG